MTCVCVCFCMCTCVCVCVCTCVSFRQSRLRQQSLRVVWRRGGRGGVCERQGPLHPMERLPALSKARPRVPYLWLPVEEEVAGPVDQAAVPHTEQLPRGKSRPRDLSQVPFGTTTPRGLRAQVSERFALGGFKPQRRGRSATLYIYLSVTETDRKSVG